MILLLLIVACAAGGVLGRDWWISEAVSKRDAEIIAEFPVVAEMLAVAVTAGVGPMSAIDRITKLKVRQLRPVAQPSARPEQSSQQRDPLERCGPHQRAS